MKVELAGHNVDVDLLENLQHGWADEAVITPETISAAYARISRDPRDITQLRAESREDIAKARKSNETIIFGYGHGSIAEHAVFNIDVIDLSRLAIEYVQQHRLASYTEKSQRYIKLNRDYFIPQELDTFTAQKYVDTVDSSFDLYNKIYTKLVTIFKEKGLVGTVAENKAKEDARYILPLCVYTQFGMTVNARELEHMLKNFYSSALPELYALADNILLSVSSIAPSLIKYISPTEYSKGNEETQTLVNGILEENNDVYLFTSSDPHVIYIPKKSDLDIELCAVILYAHSIQSYSKCYTIAEGLPFFKQKELVMSVFKNRKSFEAVKHYFEFVDFTFDLCISSSSYAQLKRHRMTSQIVQDYDAELRYTLPESFLELDGEVKEDVMEQLAAFNRLSRMLPNYAKDYAITSSHKRRVLLKINARELYQFISLRASHEAQWDIRNTANEIIELVKKDAPLIAILLCGKDNYEFEYKQLFGGN